MDGGAGLLSVSVTFAGGRESFPRSQRSPTIPLRSASASATLRSGILGPRIRPEAERSVRGLTDRPLRRQGVWDLVKRRALAVGAVARRLLSRF